MSTPATLRLASGQGRLLAALALAAAMPVWSTAAYSIASGLVLVAWVVLRPWRDRGACVPPLFLLALGVFAALLLPSVLAAPDRAAAFEEYRSYYPFLFLVLAPAGVPDFRSLAFLARCFLLSAAIAACVALLQAGGLLPWAESRVSGTVGIFEYAAVMVFAWLVAAVRFAWTDDRRDALVSWLLSLLFLAALTLNATRAAVLALLAGYLVLLLFGVRRRRLVLFVLPLLLGAPVVLWTPLGDRLAKADHEFSLVAPNSQRQAIWAHAWAMVEDHPVLGVGPGDFAAHCAELKGDERLAGFPRLRHSYHTAHSVYLHLLATSGVVGLLGFLAWLALVVAWFLRRRRDLPLVAAGALSLLAAVLAFGLTDMSLLNSRISGLLALGLGAAAGCIQCGSVAPLRATSEP